MRLNDAELENVVTINEILKAKGFYKIKEWPYRLSG